jgi:hypothetical protein
MNSKHPIVAYADRQRIEGHVSLPPSVRLSDWVNEQSPSILLTAVRIGTAHSASAQVRVSAIDAIADALPPVRNRSFEVPRIPFRIRAVFASGLVVEGDVHLPQGDTWESVAGAHGFRPLTHADAFVDGVVTERDIAILVNADRASLISPLD